MEFQPQYLTFIYSKSIYYLLKYLTLVFVILDQQPQKTPNVGDIFLLRNDLGDNRGTKIKREIPQLLSFNELRDFTVPRTGLEPARLAALAPETSASTIPPPGLYLFSLCDLGFYVFTFAFLLLLLGLLRVQSQYSFPILPNIILNFRKFFMQAYVLLEYIILMIRLLEETI